MRTGPALVRERRPVRPPGHPRRQAASGVASCARCVAWHSARHGFRRGRQSDRAAAPCPPILRQSRPRGLREGGAAPRTRRLSAPSLRTSGPSTVGFSSSSQPRAGAGAAAGAQAEAADGAAGTAAAWAVLLTSNAVARTSLANAVRGQVPAQMCAGSRHCMRARLNERFARSRQYRRKQTRRTRPCQRSIQRTDFACDVRAVALRDEDGVRTTAPDAGSRHSWSG